MKTKLIYKIPLDEDIAIEPPPPQVDDAKLEKSVNDACAKVEKTFTALNKEYAAGETRLLKSIDKACAKVEGGFVKLCAELDEKFKAKEWINLTRKGYNEGVIYVNDITALIPNLNVHRCDSGYSYGEINRDFVSSESLTFDGFQGVVPNETEVRKLFNDSISYFRPNRNRIMICGEKKSGVTFTDRNQYCYMWTTSKKKYSTNYYNSSDKRYFWVIPIYRFSINSPSASHVILKWLGKDLTPASFEFKEDSAKNIYQFLKENEGYLKADGDKIKLDRQKILDAIKSGRKFNFIPPVEIPTLPPASIDKFLVIDSSYLSDNDTLDRKKICDALKAGKTFKFLPTIDIPTVPPPKVDYEQEIIKELLECDKIRAALDPYDAKLLTDPNRGHWDLWDLPPEGAKLFKLKTPIYARDPAFDVNAAGIVGIDFGTKSTVVVYENEHGEIIPLQVGKGDYSKGNVRENYENPTIIEFRDIEKFMTAYNERDGRPQTSCNDILVSHAAQSDLDNTNDSSLFATFFENLKQWCGDEKFLAKVVDRKGKIFDLPPFLEIRKDEFNPLEIYAYYLGNYINHMLQPKHIFMNYVLSFPVTYERNIRERMLRSFEAGIKKSLPTALLSNEEAMQNFRVVEGTSEPAAYAVTALENFGFINGDDIDKIYYAVFDCGGGTTDFDFGFLRETGEDDSDAYDYILTHFGAAGDRTLGGEHLLKLLAFEIFKANISKLLKPKDNSNEKVPFTWAAEKLDFAGSEGIVRDSQEAQLNMRELVKMIRPLWEKPQSKEAQDIFNSGKITPKNIFLDTGKEYTALELAIGTQKFSFDENISAQKVDAAKTPPKPLVDVEKILTDRITRGIDNFFIALRDAFDKVSGGSDNGVDLLSDVEEIKIFLAGNSTKSAIVKKIFAEYIDYEAGKARELLGFGKSQKMPRFTIYPPLGTDEAKQIQLENGVEVDENNFATPTCKTGVAFGLLRCRDGQEIKVVDITPEGKGARKIPFQFYIGRRSKKKFKVVIDRATAKFGQWYRFISADVDTFDILYTTESIVATNDAPASIAKRLPPIHIEPDPEASVYIMPVTSNTIRYAVSKGTPPPEVEGTPITISN